MRQSWSSFVLLQRTYTVSVLVQHRSRTRSQHSTLFKCLRMHQSSLTKFFKAPGAASNAAEAKRQAEEHEVDLAPPPKRQKISETPDEDVVSTSVVLVEEVEPPEAPQHSEAQPSIQKSSPVLPVLPDIEANRTLALSRRLASHLKEPSWREALSAEFTKKYFVALASFLDQERSSGKVVLPPEDKIFTAFNLCPFNQVKVVVFGQDPYHGPNQAHGLAFSVQKGCVVPPSLKNIFNELKSDINGWTEPSHGNLERWARQGVLLLNAVLTVRRSEAASHEGHGWETFTDAVLKQISSQLSGVVFILWGNFAKKKEPLIDKKKHFILKSGHPSPLSVKHFRGCKHFSKTNELLQGAGKLPIDWALDGDLPAPPSTSIEVTSS